MTVHMPDLLTTDEAAAYLRLSERKLYELVANAAVPCTKVTGKWLFPKAALDRWLAAGLVAPAALAQAPAPPRARPACTTRCSSPSPAASRGSWSRPAIRSP